MIRSRVAFVLLVLAGAALYFGVALPARRAAERAEAELTRVEAEGQPLRQRLAEREHRRAAEEAWRRAGGAGDEGPVPGLRRSLLDSIEGARVSAVRLSVTPASPPFAARAHLSAEGSFHDLATLLPRVVGLRTGLVPEHLRWAVSGSQISLDIDGATLRRRP